MAGKNKLTLRATRSGEGPRRFTFELSLGGLITLSVAVVLGLVWVFILGVLLGRGYKPEAVVPEVAEIMPESSHQETIRKEPEVIRVEELTFPQEVRKEPAAPPAVTAPTPPTASQVPAPQAPAPQAPSVQAPQPAKPVPAPPAGPRHRYLFQTAAFVKASAAKDFQNTMKASGLNAFVEQAVVKGRTWYRVLVTVDGTEAQADKARETLRQAGVAKPLLRSKKEL